MKQKLFYGFLACFLVLALFPSKTFATTDSFTASSINYDCATQELSFTASGLPSTSYDWYDVGIQNHTPGTSGDTDNERYYAGSDTSVTDPMSIDETFNTNSFIPQVGQSVWIFFDTT